MANSGGQSGERGAADHKNPQTETHITRQVTQEHGKNEQTAEIKSTKTEEYMIDTMSISECTPVIDRKKVVKRLKISLVDICKKKKKKTVHKDE